MATASVIINKKALWLGSLITGFTLVGLGISLVVDGLLKDNSYEKNHPFMRRGRL
jgi:hypothetical protein